MTPADPGEIPANSRPKKLNNGAAVVSRAMGIAHNVMEGGAHCYVSAGNALHTLNAFDGTVHVSATPCAARSLAPLGDEWVYSSHRKEAAVTIWRRGHKSPHVKCRLAETIGPLICSPDGLYIFGGGASGSLYVWETWSGSVSDVSPC